MLHNNTNLLTGPVFNSVLFYHDKTARSMTAEASTLCQGSRRELMGRIYQDAADVGFTIHSAAHGGDATFYLTDTVCDDENDTLCWEFCPTTETLQRHPALSAYTVTVFND